MATVLACTTDDEKVLLFDRSDNLVGWTNRRTGDRIGVGSIGGEAAHRDSVVERGYGGVQIISSSIFDIMAEQPERFSVVQTWLEAVRRGSRVIGFPVDGGTWTDIGTAEKLAELDNRIRRLGPSTREPQLR